MNSLIILRPHEFTTLSTLGGLHKLCKTCGQRESEIKDKPCPGFIEVKVSKNKSWYYPPIEENKQAKVIKI